MNKAMDCVRIIEKFYAQTPDLQHILLHHSRQVAARAVAIARQLPGVDVQFVEEAAMLHDIGIIFCDAPKIQCFGTRPYLEHGYLGAELLRREGLPRHADVAERHTGTGLSEEQIAQLCADHKIDIPIRDYSPRTLEEQIVCYADKFYSKSHIDVENDLEKVRQSLLKHGETALARFDVWQQQFEPNLR